MAEKIKFMFMKMSATCGSSSNTEYICRLFVMKYNGAGAPKTTNAD